MKEILSFSIKENGKASRQLKISVFPYTWLTSIQYVPKGKEDTQPGHLFAIAASSKHFPTLVDCIIREGEDKSSETDVRFRT